LDPDEKGRGRFHGGRTGKGGDTFSKKRHNARGGRTARRASKSEAKPDIAGKGPQMEERLRGRAGGVFGVEGGGGSDGWGFAPRGQVGVRTEEKK